MHSSKPTAITRLLCSTFLIFLLPLLFPLPTIPGSFFDQKEIESAIYLESGKKFLVSGDIETAFAYFKNARSHSLEDTDLSALLESLPYLGLMEWIRGNLDSSAQYYEQALSLSKNLGDDDTTEKTGQVLSILALVKKGITFRNTNRFRESTESLEKALTLARRLDFPYHELRCLRILSPAYIMDNSDSRYEDLAEQALELAQRLNLKKEIYIASLSLGTYFFNTQDSVKALVYLHKASQIARTYGTSAQLQQVLNNLVILYMNFGDYAKAGELLNEWRALARKKEDAQLSLSALNSLGILYLNTAELTGETTDLKQALFYFEESRLLLEKNGEEQSLIMALNNTSLVHSSLGDYSRALKDISTALDLARRYKNQPEEGNLLNNRGHTLLHQQKLGDAEKAFEQALEIGRNLESGGILFRALSGLGEISRRRGDTQSAISKLTEAIGIMDAVRDHILPDVYQAGHSRRIGRVYENLMDIYWNQLQANPSAGIEEELFTLSEKAKAQAFLEYLKSAKIPESKQNLDAILPREKAMLRDIDTNLRRMNNSTLSESEREEIEARLNSTEEEFGALFARMRSSGANSLEPVIAERKHLEYVQKRLLTGETALIEYFLGDLRSYMFLLTQDSIRVFPLPGKDKLADSTKAYLKFLQNPSIAPYKAAPAARRLYTSLLSPLAKHIPEGIRHLLIIPDNILHSLPFETLLIPAAESAGEDRFLIDKYSLSYMPSAASIIFLKQQSKQPSFEKDLLIFADPSYTMPGNAKKNPRNNMEVMYDLLKRKGYEFNALPFSKEEAKRISRYFNPNSVDQFLKEEATETLLKTLPLDQYKIIHLACHGLFDEMFPLRSALVFSYKDNDEDGLLKVSEIYQLKLNAEMVVLSACQTGRGKIEGYEGVLGIPRIFFYVGARSLVSTLWQVNDRASALFMEYFYGFLTEGLSKAEALRRAKLKMAASSFSHPFYWGGYILTGDFGAIIASPKTH